MGNGLPWRIVVTARAEKELKRLPPKEQVRLRAAIDDLLQSIARSHVKKLRGKDNEWRLRVGPWRVRFTVDAAARAIVIRHVLPRGRAYRE